MRQKVSYDVDILMATFNGENFVEEQICSLLKQDVDFSRLIIRDDYSNDSTPTIISKYAQKYPSKISIVHDNKANLGPKRNFEKLLNASGAQYIMFCDQDDVWSSSKIKRSMERMAELEHEYGKNIPMMVFSDLIVVDEKLKTKYKSFWKHNRLRPCIDKQINRLLIQNWIVGCTIMINQRARDLALPIPSEAIMHDWWLALVCASLGNIASVSEPTVFYRQHSSNQIGSPGWTNYLKNCVYKSFHGNDFKARLGCTLHQAQALSDRFSHLFDQNTAEVVRTYASLENQGFFEKRINIVKFRYLKKGFLRNIGVFAYI